MVQGQQSASMQIRPSAGQEAMLQGPLDRPTGGHVALRHPAHHVSGWELLLVGGQPRESGKTLPPPPPRSSMAPIS